MLVFSFRGHSVFGGLSVELPEMSVPAPGAHGLVHPFRAGDGSDQQHPDHLCRLLPLEATVPRTK